MVVHAVAVGATPWDLVPLLYEVADGRDLPDQARGDEGRMTWRLRARHRLREPERRVDRASDVEIVALLRACLSARDRLLVPLMARAGLRCGELCGPRRSGVHLLADSRPLGCEVARAHLHVVRREANPNGARFKSRRQRTEPLNSLTLQAFDTYEFERMRVSLAVSSDFVLVNLFREPTGAPMRPGAVGELMTAAARRAGLDRHLTPHMLRPRGRCSLRPRRGHRDHGVVARTRKHPDHPHLLHADQALKEQAIARTAPLGAKPGRYQPRTRSSRSSTASGYVEQPATMTSICPGRYGEHATAQHNHVLDIQPVRRHNRFCGSRVVRFPRATRRG
jgi:integrase